MRLRTRALRLETDDMAAFRYVWDCFLANCKRVFIPSDCVTIDEQLVPFRGRCKFLQYMPSKPAKYGIKIFRMCDARVPYAIDGMIYTGRQPGEEVQRNILLKLLEKNLTIVGTLCKNKPDIPPVMKPSKSREKQSSEFGFSGNMTMVSYVPKKGKAVVLLSTMHDDRAVDDNSVKKKPEVIQYYNQTKSGVDTMDQRRWPMVLWHNVPDVATLNAYTNFTAQHPDYMGGVTNARRLFIKELGKELIMPHMKRRMEGTPQLQTHITEAMGRLWVKKNKRCHHPATGEHQTGGSSEEEEVQDLPSCQRPKSQQLVFQVHQPCVQGAQTCDCHL